MNRRKFFGTVVAGFALPYLPKNKTIIPNPGTFYGSISLTPEMMWNMKWENKFRRMSLDLAREFRKQQERDAFGVLND